MMQRHLFDRLFPPETTPAFHDNFWQIADRLSTCLIVEDGVSWLPWELLVPYRPHETESLSFLGERCQLSRWVQGLGSPRYDEIPLGDLAIAQYKFCQPAQQQQMAQDEQLTGWQRLLGATAISQGLQPALTPDNSVYAVHLLRYRSDLAREREIVPRGEISATAASGEPEIRQARLNLRLLYVGKPFGVEKDEFWGFHYPIGRTYWGTMEFPDRIRLQEGIFSAIHNKLKHSQEEIERIKQCLYKASEILKLQLICELLDRCLGSKSACIDNLLELFHDENFRYGMIHFACHCFNPLQPNSSKA